MSVDGVPTIPKRSLGSRARRARPAVITLGMLMLVPLVAIALFLIIVLAVAILG